MISALKAFRAAGLGLLLLAGQSTAHHSDAGYDHDAVVAFSGTLINYDWRNPHVHLYVEVEDEAGQTETWKIESGSTPILSRSGWSPDSLTEGEVVSVRARPARSGEAEALLLTVQRSDGGVLAQNDSLVFPDTVATGMFGIWKGRAGEPNDFKPRLVALETTDAGEVARAAYDHATQNPLLDCLAFPTPRLMDSPSYVFEIRDLGDRITIESEYLDAFRTIYMDGREHPQTGERTLHGHSIGHWEDDVLVVDTRLFADHPSPNRNGVPSGSQKHVVERFWLSEDRTRLMLEVFMEDPEFLAETFEGAAQLYYAPGFERQDYNCEPERGEG